MAVGASASFDVDMTGLNSPSAATSDNRVAIVVNYDTNGTVVYKKKLGGSTGEEFSSVANTSDGGFVTAGSARSSDGDMAGYVTNGVSTQAMIVKYNSLGIKEWLKIIGGTADDSFKSVIQAKNGNYIAVGNTSSVDGELLGLQKGLDDAMIAEFNSSGNFLRVGTIGGQGRDYFTAGTLLNDANTYVAVGDTASGVDGSNLKKKVSGIIQIFDMKFASSIPEFLSSTTELTNKDVSVTITFPVSTVARQYKIGAQGTWINYTAPVVMAQNNTLFARYTNSNGTQSQEYSYVVNNIDKTPPTMPKFVPDIADPTTSNVNVTIDFPNELIKEYRVNGGTWTAYTKPVLFTTNGSIEARVVDNAGNSSSAIYSVSNIDRTPPGVTSFSSDMTGPTNSNVTVSIRYPADGYRNEYRVGTGEWQFNYYSPVSYYARENVILYARSIDKAGNVSAIYSYEVKNIDKVPPADAILAVDVTTPTNKDVKVTINYPADAVIKEYKEGLGSYKVYTNPITVTSNTTVYARSKDAAGNYSAETKLIISNIDKTPPSKPVITADRSKPAEGIVTVSINYPDSDATKEYRQNGGAWKNYTGPIEYTIAGNLEARAIDGVGNSSTSLFDVNVGPGQPSITPNITVPTKANVMVSINYTADSVVKEYLVDNGSWKKFTNSIEIAQNGVVKARATDSYGYFSIVSVYNVNNIDKTPPAAATFSRVPFGDDYRYMTNQDVVVTVTFPSDAVIKEYSMNSGAWTRYTDPVVFKSNGNIKARSSDALGNTSTPASYDITNIDKEAPPIPTIEASVTTPTNKNVTVTITYPPDPMKNFKNQYRINNGSWYNAQSVIKTYEFEKNGVIEARTLKDSGAASMVVVYEINNIDKVKPHSITFKRDVYEDTFNGVNVTITYPDPNEIITIFYQLGSTEGKWLTYNGPIKVSSNTTIYAYVKDAAGNSTFYQSYKVTNILSKNAQYIYDSITGRLKYVYLITGEKYEYVYDANGNLKAVKVVQP
ncbi:hypothetical protein D3C75_371100 [compost metagenome]